MTVITLFIAVIRRMYVNLNTFSFLGKSNISLFVSFSLQQMYLRISFPSKGLPNYHQTRESALTPNKLTSYPKLIHFLLKFLCFFISLFFIRYYFKVTKKEFLKIVSFVAKTTKIVFLLFLLLSLTLEINLI